MHKKNSCSPSCYTNVTMIQSEFSYSITVLLYKQGSILSPNTV